MSKTASILFVDDEERIVKLLNIMFRDKYEVFTATSGREAIEIVKSRHINVLVSDQRMPNMTGIELLAEARKMSPHTMRILLTGYSDLVAIIGAVNEGEVYRFLNKPWNHDEIKNTLAECAEIALSTSHLFNAANGAEFTEAQPPLATATKLLALDGVAQDRYEVVEMFTSNYNVVPASSIEGALRTLEQQEVGVVVTDSRINGEDISELLSILKQHYPLIVTVVLSSSPDSDQVVKLINQAQIYRFAMKPISPNVFRLAVSAAMREHHRLLADPRLASRNKVKNLSESETSDISVRILKSLARFTKIW